jgi:Zn-finger nucleic acid-binding protein
MNMLCPNCNEEMHEVNHDDQNVLHCKNCGGTFFAQNGINRISPHTAEILSKDKITTIVHGKPKICPHDNLFMTPLQEESIPNHITLYACPKCQGVFTYPEDLVAFKNAQRAKVDFFKLWNIPLPSVQAVLVLGIFAVIGLTFIATASNIRNPLTTASSAQDIISNISFSTSGRYLFMSFKTSRRYTANLILLDGSNKTILTQKMDNGLTTIHFATISNVDLHQSLYYQVMLTDAAGKQYKTAVRKVDLK